MYLNNILTGLHDVFVQLLSELEIIFPYLLVYWALHFVVGFIIALLFYLIKFGLIKNTKAVQYFRVHNYWLKIFVNYYLCLFIVVIGIISHQMYLGYNLIEIFNRYGVLVFLIYVTIFYAVVGYIVIGIPLYLIVTHSKPYPVEVTIVEDQRRKRK